MQNITVEHSLVKKGGKVRFRKFTTDGYDQFRLRVNVSGPLDEIAYIEYELHPTFRDPVRISTDRKNGFPIEFWTWGEFEVLVTVHLAEGRKAEQVYMLEYSEELPSTDEEYFDETPENLRG